MSERDAVGASLAIRLLAGALAFLAAVTVALTPVPATAVELPPAANQYWIQTNGPNSAITLGDWYTSGVAGGGAGYHYVQFQVPCGWPAATPISVDLFSPEENRVAGATPTHEEPNGNYDSTQFELYGPGATVGPGFANPAPGAGIAGTRTTYQPGAAGVAEAWVRFATLGAPVACGSYVVRSQVLTADPLNPGGTGDDQNGWKLRVGTDNDANPNNATPANYDNPDGVAGTNDELMVGMAQVSFQQSSGAVACQTFYEYTTPGQASATFNNFDMDGVTRLRYYAPGDPAYDATATTGGTVGTMSGNGIWNNGGTLTARVGDTIASPTTGWWRIVNCLTDGNQLIQEGQPGVLSYYTQPPTPNMTLTKTDGVATASPGQALTYNITATNNSPAAGGGAANNVVVTDTIPAGFTYTGCSIPTPTQGSWTCSQAAGVVTFTQTGWINRGAAAVLRVTGTVNQGVTGSITNTARINYTDGLGNPFPQVTTTDVDTITASSNLSITKTDSTDPENPGQSFNYTLTVNNAGPSDATNLTVSDTVPTQYTVNTVTSPTGSCANVGNAVTCTRLTFASGAAAWVITVNVTVKASTPGGTYLNTATVSATEADPTPANNTANQNNTVRNTADLVVTKTDGVATVNVGGSTTYTITLTNNGPTVVPAGIIVSDTIPANTVGSEAEADCTITAGVFRCTTSAPLAVGATNTYQLTLTLSASFATATLVNTASVTTIPATFTDPVAANNTATDTDTVPQANLSITKTDSTDPENPGASFNYVLTVNNAGPSTATNLTVSDTVPSQYTVNTVTSPTGSCGNVGNAVTCTLASMASGAPAWVITVNVTVKLTTPGGTYVNTATVSAASPNDPTPANNTVNNNNTVRATADLALTKTDGVASVNVGSSTTYTITVTNNGVDNEPAGIIISDTIPAGTNASETEADCTITAGVFRCTTVTPLAVGASRSYQLTLALPAAYAAATLVNTATITTFPIPDLTAANNSATDTDTVPQANLSIAKADSVDPVNPGASFNYTLTVNNAGPSTATNLTVSDTVPSQYTVNTVTSPTGSCGNVGNAVTCTLASMASGAPAWVITINVTVKLTTPGGTYVNTATVSAASLNDPTPANNTVNNNNTVAAFGDLVLTKSDGTATVTAGTSTTYTITITNNGPSTEPAGVRFTDTIPAGTVGSETEADCAIAAGVFTCNTAATIAAGASRSYQLTLSVPSGYAPATVVNTANITIRPIVDPDLTNNSATDTDTVVRSADLSIAKTDSADPVVPGQAFTYTLTVTNGGPSDAATLSVSDTVPAQFTVTNVTSPAGSCGFAGQVVTCTRPTLANAATWVITVFVTTVAAAPGGTFSNTATVSAATSDPVPANDSASQNTTISVSADLAVTKTDGVASVVAGTSTDYTITLTNNGPSAVAAGVVVSDPVPAGTVGSETEPNCALGAGTFTCTTTAVLASGASVVYHLIVAVPAGYAPATVVNTANITSAPATDPTPANNAATDTDTVTKSADLAITKTDGVASVVAGTSTTYTITVTNNGPSDEPAGVVVSDPIPAGTVGSESESDCAIAAGSFTCTTSGVIAAGSSVVYQLTLAVAASFAPANLSNTASISSTPVVDPNGANNAATDTDSVSRSADLSIVKIDSADPVVPGQGFTYTLTMTNNGPSDASTLQVSDTVPAEFTVTNVTSPAGSCGFVGNAVTCTRPTLAAGASWAITVSVTANLAAPAGTYTNTATVSAATADPVLGNNSGSQDTDIVPSADLSIVKTDSADPVNPNTSFDYTIVVTNNGPSDAANVLVTDSIPGAGFFTVNSVVASTGSCGFIGSDVMCTLASLPTGAIWTITVTVDLSLGTPGGLYTNTAHVTSATFDPDLSDNDGSQSTVVLPAADLVITKDDGVGSVVAGGSTTYAITLRNDGPSTEPAGVVVSDAIPAGTTGSTLDPDCAVAAGTFTCTTSGSLAPFASVTYHLTLDVPPDYAPATLVNTATIDSTPVAETDPSDNSSTDTDTVILQGDLALTKTDGVATVVAGTSTTYAITATNNGPSQIPAGVVIFDPIPAGTNGSESEADCSIAAGTFTCTTSAPIAVGGFVTYQLTLAVAPGLASPTLVNTVSVTSSPAVDTNPANDSASDTDTVTTSADLALTKTDGVATITAGTSTTYTITVTNNGPSTEPAGVVLSDPIPAGTNGSESEADCSIAAGTFTCTTSAPIAPGGSRSYQLTLAVPPASLIVTVVNTVSITSAPVPTDPDASNNSATDTDAVIRSGDLSITKSDGIASVIAGTSTTYTITVTNLGPSTEPAGVVVDDPIPAGTTPSQSEADCVIAAGAFTCTTSAPLAPGAFVTYQLTLAVPANSALVSLVNTSTITVFPIADPAAGNNAATDTDTVTTSADLSVTKTDSADPVNPGDVFDYVITVTNNGPSDAQGLTVTDSVPAPGSFSVTGVVASAGACGNVGNDVTCTLGTLVPGATWTITISVLLDPGTPGGLYTDTATVTSTTPDPLPGNNSDAESTIVLPAVDMVLTKTDGVASVAAGTSTTYLITLTNGGPSDEPAGAIVSDPIPAGTTGSESEADCVIAAGAFTCTTSSLLTPGDSVSYQLTLLVSPSYASPTLANTATVTFTPVAETDPSDDSATDVDTVTSTADLAISKTDLIDPVLAGDDVTYTVTVSNLGPSDAAAVVVTDTLPGSVTFVSATPSQGSCSQAAGIVTCPIGVVPSGATATITIVITTTIDGLITDTATVSATTSDPVPANNTDNETTTVTPAADLRIAKSDGVALVAAGTSTTYAITLTNDGPSTVPAGVVITDAIPAATNGSESDINCSIVGTTFTCTTPAPLASGASISFQLTLGIPAAYSLPSVSNTATISSSPIVDLDPANDSATDIDALSTSADLTITKTDAVDPVALGANVVYTITVTNNGPSDAVGVDVVDTLPGFSSFVSATPSQGSCSEVAGIVTCPLGTLPAGGVATITVVVGTTVAAVITNLATVTAITPDPVPGNNDASQDTTVTSTADLVIAKTDGVATVVAGTSTTYTITLTNNGPSAEPAGVVVSDPIPAGTVGSESEADCTVAAGAFTCTTSAPLALGASISYQLTLAITSGYVLPSLTNTASIASSPVADPDASNDTATDVDTVTVTADLSISKSDGVTTVKPGTSTTFTITVTNNGPSDVPAGIVVTDQLPSGTVASESEANCTLTATTFTCTTTAALAAGASVVYRLTLAIDPAYVSATLVNTASITASPVPDPNPANDTSSDADTITPLDADLSIVKTDSADPVMPGDSFSYTIVVTNAGPDDARDVALTDNVPGVLTISAVTSSGTGTCLTTGQSIVCGIDPLAAAATWTITVQVGVPPGTPSGTVTNTATVAGTGDTDLTNDSASETTTIGELVGSADLTVTKTVDDASPAEGNTLEYVVTITNGGPDDATGVEITDALPAGLTFVSATASQGSYQASTGVWTVGSLAVGESAGLQIRARVDDGTGGTTLTNRALVSAVDQGDPTPGDADATAPVVVAEAAGGGPGGDDGGTAFTGFPGVAVIAWMFGLAMLGLFALALGSRRRVIVEPAGDDHLNDARRSGRFQDTPDPFLFFKREE